MSTKMMIELFGYLGSGLVVISMLMTSVVRLRIFNLTGCVIFAIYALIIKSYPTALMNLFLVGINLYHLMRLHNTEKNFDLVAVDVRDRYLQHFLYGYQEDILNFFPDFKKGEEICDRAYITCCDDSAVGVALGKQTGKDELELIVDYSTPVYRDCSVGNFLYDKLASQGIRKLTYKGTNKAHIDYVTKMGFKKQDDGAYAKKLG